MNCICQEIMWNIISGLFVFIMAAALCTLFQCKIEKTIAVTVGGIIAVMYFFSLIKRMHWGFYFLLLIVLISFVYLLVSFKAIKIKDLFSCGGIYYWVVLFLACVQNKYRVVALMGDLIQRGLITKYSYITNELINASGRQTVFLEYPPATSLFHYFWMKTGTSFEDSRMYISMAILLAVFMIPVLEKVSLKHNHLASAVISIILYISLFSFYPSVYCDLANDCFMGICFAYILYMECYEENKTIKRLGISLALFTLILAKSSGIIFAVFSVVIIFIRFCMQNRLNENVALKKQSRISLICYLVSCIFAKGSWSLYIKYLGVMKTFDVSLSKIKWGGGRYVEKAGVYKLL